MQQNAEDNSFRWDAFLSHSQEDSASVRRIQRFLEGYRLPKADKLRVFRDETDQPAGSLSERLRDALRVSRCLVVCCSKAAAQSEWVEREIVEFRNHAPERPVLVVQVADDYPGNIPPALRSERPEDDILRCDVRNGWRWGRVRRKAREDLVRVVSAVAEIDFRELLPLDRHRRRRARIAWISAVAVFLAGSASVPVEDWEPLAKGVYPVVGCDTLEDGIAVFRNNPPQSIKKIVRVYRDVFGAQPHDEALDDKIIAQGRMLPGHISGVGEKCGRSPREWVAEPAPGICVRLSESDQRAELYDPMGGDPIPQPLTDVIVNDMPSQIDRFWFPIKIDAGRWHEEYGRTLQPSDGLPISAVGKDLWVGFPDADGFRGGLWRRSAEEHEWVRIQGITDVRSIRRLRRGTSIAARRDGELGFFVYGKDGFEPFDVPGKGDDLEICGEIGGQPVIRVDRNVYRRLLRSWWYAQLK